MRKPKIKIIARDRKDKNDKAKANLLQQVMDYQVEQGRFQGVIDSITAIQVYLKLCYGDMVVVPSSMWDRILNELVKLEIENIEKSS